MMLDSGEAPRYIADQLGHVDLAMIIRHYGRWTQKPRRLLAGGFAQAAEKADQKRTKPAGNVG